MHIAWLGKKSPFCGNVTYGREVTNALQDRGHRVSFLHFADEDDVPADEVSLPFLYKSQIYTLPNPKANKVLADALRSLQPDLVHASLALSPLDFTLPELCAELELPLVATFHPAFDRHRRNFASRTQHLLYQIHAPSLANYDRVIVFSEIQRELLISLGIRPERAIVIPNGVDVAKFSPGSSSIKRELGADILFAYQGRISPEKNVEAMLKAWRQAQLGERVKLAMVGDGPQAATLKSFYPAEYGVEWLGYIADEQRRIEILRGADVFLLPSLVEGLSLSLLEAMACGTAALATDVGADGEAIEGGAGICLAPHKVANALTTLLPVLCEHPEFVMMLQRQARQRVIDRYTLSRNIDRVEALYAELLDLNATRVATAGMRF